MRLSNKAYDFLKWYAILGANAISGFLIYCGQALQQNGITIVAGIVAASGVCVGACLGLSSHEYNKPADMDVTGLVYLEDGDENE